MSKEIIPVCTPRAKNVFKLAAEEAKANKLDYISTRELLIGLLREEEGTAYKILSDLAVTLEMVRRT